jgi:hypothetical protein
MTGHRGSKRSHGKNSINRAVRIGQFARRVRNEKERILRHRGIRRVTIRQRDRREHSAEEIGRLMRAFVRVICHRRSARDCNRISGASSG